jgi:hypothetical protein
MKFDDFGPYTRARFIAVEHYIVRIFAWKGLLASYWIRPLRRPEPLETS